MTLYTVRTVKTIPGGMTNAIAPHAERVVEYNYWAVELDLNPIASSLIGDLALALRGHAHWLVVLSHLEPTSAEYTAVLADILALSSVRQALTQTITPKGAQDLSGQLWDAKDEPDWCRTEDCPNYATVGDRCDSCQADAENRSPIRWA